MENFFAITASAKPAEGYAFFYRARPIPAGFAVDPREVGTESMPFYRPLCEAPFTYEMKTELGEFFGERWWHKGQEHWLYDGTVTYGEWINERLVQAASMLRDCVEVDPDKRGGVPVLNGTRFPVAQIVAELAEGKSITRICSRFDLDLACAKKFLEAVAICLDRPYRPFRYDELPAGRMFQLPGLQEKV